MKNKHVLIVLMSILLLGQTLPAGTTLPVLSENRFGTYAAGGLGLWGTVDVWKSDIEQAKKLNIGIVRGNTDTWDLLEPKRGHYTWERLDAIVQLLNDQHVEFLFTLPISSRWNGPGKSIKVQGFDVGPSHFCTRELDSVHNLCKAIASRYKGRLTYFEVWNEQDFDLFWEGHADAKKYIDYLQAAYTGLKAGNPNCIVLMGGLAKPSEPGWFDQFLAQGGARYFDIANIHVYPAFGTLSSALQNVRGLMQKYQVRKPIWITETSSTGLYFETADRKREEYNKAVHLVKTYAEALSQPDVERIFWHSLRNPGADIRTREMDFGLMTNKAEPLPAFYAYSQFRDLLLNSQPLGKLTLPGIEGYAFDRQGKRFWVVWATKGTARIDFPPDYSKARVIRLGGKSMDITQEQFSKLSIASEPIYLELSH